MTGHGSTLRAGPSTASSSRSARRSASSPDRPAAGDGQLPPRVVSFANSRRRLGCGGGLRRTSSGMLMRSRWPTKGSRCRLFRGSSGMPTLGLRRSTSKESTRERSSTRSITGSAGDSGERSPPAIIEPDGGPAVGAPQTRRSQSTSRRRTERSPDGTRSHEPSCPTAVAVCRTSAKAGVAGLGAEQQACDRPTASVRKPTGWPRPHSRPIAVYVLFAGRWRSRSIRAALVEQLAEKVRDQPRGQSCSCSGAVRRRVQLGDVESHNPAAACYSRKRCS